MGRILLSRLWLMRVVYLILCLFVIFCHLLPLDTLPRVWAPPDLLIAFTFAWALRRPEYVPILSIAAVFLTADLLFQRPPGLMAALVVIGTENLRVRFAGLRGSSFVGEWVAVCMMIAAITMVNRLILNVLGVDLAPFGPTAIQALLTIAVYPVAVLATQAVMGIRKPAPRDADGLGGRA